MPIASINGVDLYYEVEGDGDWVAFAHGGEGLHLCWWKQITAFRQRFRCLTYDARGFGLSGGGWGGLPEDSAASDLLGLLDHLGIERAFLVGHSMGGMAVSGVAQRAPERVRALVMGDTPFGFLTAALSKWAIEMLRKIPLGFNVFEHLFAPGFAEAEPELHCLYTGLCRLNSVRPLPKDTGDYLDAYVRMRDSPPVDYSRFAVPSLFIVGDKDELTLPWLMEETAKRSAARAFWSFLVPVTPLSWSGVKFTTRPSSTFSRRSAAAGFERLSSSFPSRTDRHDGDSKSSSHVPPGRGARKL